MLVDATAFAPTNRFDVAAIRPDFVAVSFYKIIGFPTGVGCLLVRRDRLDRLRRPWFSGGTVTIASVQGDGHYLRPDAGAFEDGTVDYLNLPAVGVGLGFLERIGRDADPPAGRCASRAGCSTPSPGCATATAAAWSRSTDRPTAPTAGGTIAFLVRDRDGRVGRRPTDRGAGQPRQHLAAHRLLLQPGRRRGGPRPRARRDGAVVRSTRGRCRSSSSATASRASTAASCRPSGSRSGWRRTSPTSTASCASCRASSTAPPTRSDTPEVTHDRHRTPRRGWPGAPRCRREREPGPRRRRPHAGPRRRGVRLRQLRQAVLADPHGEHVLLRRLPASG